MKKLELTPDVLRLLAFLEYRPESRQFVWRKHVGGPTSTNRRAGCLVGNQCYISFLGKRYRTDQLADLVEADHNLCLSPTAHP